MKKILLIVAAMFAFSGLGFAAGVELNTATKEQLMTLKEIGDKRAQSIIDYRSANGPFKSTADLEKIKIESIKRELDEAVLNRLHSEFQLEA